MFQMLFLTQNTQDARNSHRYQTVYLIKQTNVMKEKINNFY